MTHKVWILFSVANDYNQPDKAFEKLFWEMPILEDFKKIMDKEDAHELLKNNFVRASVGADYWLETFSKNK